MYLEFWNRIIAVILWNRPLKSQFQLLEVVTRLQYIYNQNRQLRNQSDSRIEYKVRRKQLEKKKFSCNLSSARLKVINAQGALQDFYNKFTTPPLPFSFPMFFHPLFSDQQKTHMMDIVACSVKRVYTFSETFLDALIFIKRFP